MNSESLLKPQCLHLHGNTVSIVTDGESIAYMMTSWNSVRESIEGIQ